MLLARILPAFKDHITNRISHKIDIKFCCKKFWTVNILCPLKKSLFVCLFVTEVVQLNIFNILWKTCRDFFLQQPDKVCMPAKSNKIVPRDQAVPHKFNFYM